MAVDESWRRIFPRGLAWAEVDPARHPFDPAEAGAVVRALAPAPPHWIGYELIGGDAAERWREQVSHALVDRYGRWASGWC